MNARVGKKSFAMSLLATLLLLGRGAAALSGGPDAFGYRFIDSTEVGGPAYDFEDISSSGSSISLADNQVSGAVSIGFTFSFYGVNYTNVYIGSNGFLTFLSGQDTTAPTAVPTAASPNAIIAAWAADLYPPDFGGVRYQTLGSSSNRRFIAQYTYIGHAPTGSAKLVTCQTKLFESTNTIEVHYNASPSDGSVHLVGIENETGSIGLQYYSGTEPLAFPCAVRFYDSRFEVSPEDDYYASGPKGGTFGPALYTYTLSNIGTAALNWTASKNASWLNLSATSGTLLAGHTADVTASINSNALALNDGTYTDSITLTSTTTGATRTRTVTLLVSDFVSDSHPWPSLWYFGRDFYVDWTGYQPDNTNFYFWRIDTAPSTSVTIADEHVPVSQQNLSPASVVLNDWTYYFHLAAAGGTNNHIFEGSQRDFQLNMAGYPAVVSSPSHPSNSSPTKARDFIATAAAFHFGGSPCPDLQDGFESHTFTTLPWTFVGSPWTFDTYAHSGQYAARASSDGHLRIAAVCQGISFWQRESIFKTLYFYVDGILTDSWYENSWTYVSYQLERGQHTFEWSCPGSNVNYDACIDDVYIQGFSPVPQSSIVRYRYQVNDNPLYDLQDNYFSCAPVFPIVFPATLPGTHWFHVLAEDSVGNPSEPAH